MLDRERRARRDEEPPMSQSVRPAPPVVREIEAKSILNASKIHDWCVNPYTGCEVGCVYCYAALFMRRYSGHSEPWGEFVDVKVNAPALLARQIVRARRGTIWFGSVCDPYQPLEERYALTRRLLEALVGLDFPVEIQTKSARVRRDLDVIRRLPEVQVGFTIATDDETIAALFERRASPVAERVEILRGSGPPASGPSPSPGRSCQGIPSAWPHYWPGPPITSSSTA